MYRCPECDFVYDLARAASAAADITTSTAQMAQLLEQADETVARRPQPEVWSALEYGCHVRDVLLVQRERVYVARLVERPEVQLMGRDQRVDYDGYATQDPVAVARQLRDAAALFANCLDRLGADDWDREVIYGFPQRKQRSLRWVAVHTVHEVRHHLGDVKVQLAP